MRELKPSELVDLSNVPGEILGAGYPAWPEWAESFEARRAYQIGVAHARAVDAGLRDQRVSRLIEERDAWKSEAEFQRRCREETQRHVDDLARLQRRDVWYWQDDGEDHLESMGNQMLVLIRAPDLRALVAPKDEPK